MSTKIIGCEMTKAQKDKDDIEMLFGTRQERARARRRAYYARHREEEKERNRLWRGAHRERLLAKGAAYRAANQERMAAYRNWYYNTFEKTSYSLICGHCGWLFTGRKNQMFCSRDCALKKRREKHRKKPYLKDCVYCGKEFTGNKRKIYCSHSCSNRAWRLNKSQPTAVVTQNE